MCVIVYKPQNKSLNIDDLADMWDRNPHGAGIAWQRRSKIRWVKGMMDFDTFIHTLGSIDRDDSKELVIHFRLATHGSVEPLNCHPFPVYAKNALKGEDEAVLFHNGILNQFGKSGKDGMSDSHDFTDSILSAIGSKEIRKLLPHVGGRFAYWDAKGVLLTGGFTEKDKCEYSNMNWKSYTYKGKFDNRMPKGYTELVKVEEDSKFAPVPTRTTEEEDNRHIWKFPYKIG